MRPKSTPRDETTQYQGPTKHTRHSKIKTQLELSCQEALSKKKKKTPTLCHAAHHQAKKGAASYVPFIPCWAVHIIIYIEHTTSH
jgi:hypothetical protein